MRESIKSAIGETVQDLINSGLKTSFTKKELDSLGVEIPEVHLTNFQIKEIREKMNLSQTVFAKLLNVSPSSIRQWEQGKRKPSGSTKALLDLLKRSPEILDYRLKIHQKSKGKFLTGIDYNLPSCENLVLPKL